MNGKELAVQGFAAAAVSAGIKYQDRLDVGLIYSEKPAAAAGVFTTSLVKAAPVLLDIERIQSGCAQAIIVNSGNANACTGEQGMEAARRTSTFIAEALGIAEEMVLVASTGVIGQPLDAAKFEAVARPLAAVLSPEGVPDVARAIMTTDTVSKTAVRHMKIGGQPCKLVGIAKGAGMIMPNMATMLCFVITDAAIAHDVLATVLRTSVDRSFNIITIDGDTSTNDTVLVLANGLAGNKPVTKSDSQATGYFQEQLDSLLLDLARQVVKDGEGATKFVAIRIAGARNDDEASAAGKTIANSPLVKTAFFGEDANWGRIIAALGRSGAVFDPARTDIAFDDVFMVKQGLGLGPEAEKAATAILKKSEFTVTVDLHAGNATATIYTCDLSVDYIKINADYRS